MYSLHLRALSLFILKIAIMKLTIKPFLVLSLAFLAINGCSRDSDNNSNSSTPAANYDAQFHWPGLNWP